MRKQDEQRQYNALKKREERERMRDDGFILRQLWVHPKDWAYVKKLVSALRISRED